MHLTPTNNHADEKLAFNFIHKEAADVITRTMRKILAK
jgi:hypothetical protein